MYSALFFILMLFVFALSAKKIEIVRKFDADYFLRAFVVLFILMLGSGIVMVYCIPYTVYLLNQVPMLQDKIWTATQVSEFIKTQTFQVYKQIDPVDLLRVWWEDCAYVLPSIIAYGYGYRKLSWAALLALAPSFVEGHLYQGPMGYISFMYLIVAREISIKHGFITMMFLHVLFDFLIYYRTEIYLQLVGAI